MTSRDFCYWLQGFFEIEASNNAGPHELMDAGQVRCIKNHLALVFKHEIDPSQGSPAHQAELQQIHDAPPLTEPQKITLEQIKKTVKKASKKADEAEKIAEQPRPYPHPGGTVYRC